MRDRVDRLPEWVVDRVLRDRRGGEDRRVEKPPRPVRPGGQRIAPDEDDEDRREQAARSPVEQRVTHRLSPERGLSVIDVAAASLSASRTPTAANATTTNPTSPSVSRTLRLMTRGVFVTAQSALALRTPPRHAIRPLRHISVCVLRPGSYGGAMSTTCMGPDEARRAPQRPEQTAIRSIIAPGQAIERRLVRNPARPMNSILFSGWGPRLSS
jgi:hypothetical protein